MQTVVTFQLPDNLPEWMCTSILQNANGGYNSLFSQTLTNNCENGYIPIDLKNGYMGIAIQENTLSHEKYLHFDIDQTSICCRYGPSGPPSIRIMPFNKKTTYYINFIDLLLHGGDACDSLTTDEQTLISNLKNIIYNQGTLYLHYYLNPLREYDSYWLLTDSPNIQSTSFYYYIFPSCEFDPGWSCECAIDPSTIPSDQQMIDDADCRYECFNTDPCTDLGGRCCAIDCDNIQVPNYERCLRCNMSPANVLIDATSTYKVLGLFPNACSTSIACNTSTLSSVQSLTMVHDECEFIYTEDYYLNIGAYFVGMSNPFMLCTVPYMLPGTSENVGRSCNAWSLVDLCED